MKKRILFLMAAVVIGSGVWVVTILSRPDAVQQTPPSSGSASVPQRQEPVGWVFGRLVGVQQSVYAPSGYAPSGQGMPLQGPPPPRSAKNP